MKIALINPMGPRHRFDDSNDQLPPLGLLYLAAAVRPRHEVTVLDGELLKQTGPALINRLPFEPDLIGIGGTTSQAGEACNLARRAREMFPRAKIVAGGTHASLLAADCLRQCEAFDAVICGPGEAPFAMLADGCDPAVIPRTIVRGGNGARLSPRPTALDLVALPLPARDLVNIHHYSGTSHRLFGQTAMMATRGCAFQRTFCSNSAWGLQWLPRPIESVVEELKEIAALEFAEVLFQDDALNANPDWTLRLFEAIRQAGLGLEYQVEFRVNARFLPERLLEAAAAAGVKEISYAVESGNGAVREAAGNDLPREEIVRAVRLTKARGIATLCSFTIGLPGETSETVRETLQLAVELDPETARFSIATPFPGTEIREKAIQSGRLLTQDYDALALGVSVMRTEALSCEEVTRLHDEVSRDWEAHVRLRSGDAEKSVRALEERSCREALRDAILRGDALGQAIINSRLARIRLDNGDNAEAIQFLAAALAEPALSNYDRANAGVVLAIALRREGLQLEAATALDRIEAIAHPAHREWIERERTCLSRDSVLISLPALRAPSIGAVSKSARKRSEFSNARQIIERAMQVAAREGFPVGQWPGELAMACMEIWNTQANTVLEIGVNHGGWIWVTRNFCSKPLSYIGIDPTFTDHWPHCAAMLKAEGVQVSAIKTYSQHETTRDAVLEALGGRPVDVLHIDGDHAAEAALRDFDLYAPLVRPGGLVLMHDVGRLKYVKDRNGAAAALYTILSTDRAERISELKTVVEQHFESFDRHMGIAMLRIAGQKVCAA